MPRIDKRQHIMQAAERLFTSRQFHEVTTDDVASAANVGKGTIYRYFQDKDDLLFQITTSGFDELCELLHSQVSARAGFREQLLGACEQIRQFFKRRRELLRMMEEENGRIALCEGRVRDRWLQRRKNLVSAVGAILAKGISEGRVRTDIPAEDLGIFLLGMLRTQARDLAEASPPSRGQVDVVVELFCNGVIRPDAVSPARLTPGKSHTYRPSTSE